MSDQNLPGTTPPSDPSSRPQPAPSAYEPPPYEAPAYEAPAYQAPAYAGSEYAAAPPAPYGAPAQQSVPGRTLGIVAFVLAIVPIGLQLVGLILGIVALVQSRKAGAKNGWALAAIIVGAVLLVVGVIVAIVLIAAFAGAAGDLSSQIQACLDNGGTGTIEFQGVVMSCEELLEGANR